MNKNELTQESLKQLSKESEYKVPNLDRGLSVLEYLTNHPFGLTVSEISRQLEIPKNSSHRIMMTLTSRGFTFRNESTKKFSLTNKLLKFGSSTICEQSIIENSIETMRALRDLIDETVLLNCKIGHKGVVLEQVMSRKPIRLVIDPGTQFNLYPAAPGKLMLAFSTVKEQDDILCELIAGQVICQSSKEEIIHSFDLIKSKGIAYDYSDTVDGMNCLSAPIFNNIGELVATLTVSGTVKSIPKRRLKELTPLLINYANKISLKLKL